MKRWWWPTPANDNSLSAVRSCCSCRCHPYVIGIDSWWLNGQLDLAGFQTHLVLGTQAFDPSATIYFQLQAMGDRGV